MKRENSTDVAVFDEEIDTEDEDQVEIDPEKEAKREREKQLLIARLNADDHTHLITRIAHLLNRFPNTRNSDVTLMLKYWEIYSSESYKEGQAVDPKDLYQFERLTAIARARAKIQNEFRLFRADEKVRRFRKSKEEIEKEIQLSTKPEIPTLTIYCDETGKNKKYAIVGSVWILDRSEMEKIYRILNEWKRINGLGIKDEFHFTEMKKHELDLYKQFFNKVIELGSMISFKAIVFKMENSKRKIDDLLSDLHYQLVHIGIEHEAKTGRVGLPRLVNFTKDKEEGNDKLTLTKIEQHLQLQFKVNYDEELKLNMFVATESWANILLQVADLFAGSLNRFLNEKHSNYKDEFAEHVFSLLGIDAESMFVTEKDMVKIIQLE
ncbi:DUF3800 domain-containing protein [Cohnella soli]|uniref:DUF3800 domain-containing protein n=1 Tax=Cohnella soli TaxID=425005 RepID=A0ABW0HS01_9BACL